MEESGDAIEYLLFGFRIQHYGVAHPKFHVCILNRPLLTIDLPLTIVHLGYSFQDKVGASTGSLFGFNRFAKNDL